MESKKAVRGKPLVKSVFYSDHHVRFQAKLETENKKHRGPVVPSLFR